ncbi:MAG: hypothetical protein LAO31_05440 [Acidobacteriia bacterium]|nr:hypothetical protein [Terriglobia bacterium]
MSLRKLTLVALALTFLLTGATLFAQQVPHFVLSSTNTVVRQHGQTEVLGDLTLTCDVAGTFPTNSTFSVIYSPVAGLVNAADTTNLFTNASAQVVNARVAHVESEPATTTIVIGTVSLNTVVTNSITVQVSGTAAPGDIIRVMGIRANIAGASLPPNTSVNATIIAIPPNAFQIDNVSTISVAFVLDEIKVTVSAADPILACQPGVCQTDSITIQEKFPSALTTVTDENDLQHKPSGVGATNGPPKRASFGTQIIVTMLGIPPGVLVAFNGQSGTTLTMTAVAPTTFTNTSTTTPASATFTFNTATDDINLSEEVTLFFTFCPTSGIPAPPVLSTITAQATLGPNRSGTFTTTVPSASILSFVKNLQNTPPDPIETLANCVTNLLCKFISTATGAVPGGGYDTGLAIANTSTDIFGDLGAVPQTGACRMFLFGSGGTNANINSTTKPVFTTPLVASGTSAVFDAKFTAGVGAGFQGYSIIQCDFQFGHAEAIISDQQFSTFSHGYDCLIIPDVNLTGGRFAIPVGFNGGGSGESGESLGEKRVRR